MPLAACRLPLAACLLTLCSLTIAASNSDARARGNFADFYKAQQARILSAIDDTIATQAERAITDNFAAIKRTGVQLQTGLGGRKGNIAMDFIGSFADSADSAFGWQLRGYKGQQDSTGANVGIFYRKIDGDTLFGANAFADYEDGDYGGFLRYSIGGEVQSAWLALHANYYAPITDERRIQMTVAALLRQPIAAFSRQGYDAKLRINPPSYDKLKAAVDYYNFDGKHGAESEEGLRYGMELNISPALKAGLFYDDGADKVGGELSYSHTIGESQTRHSRAEGAGISHSPDLFAPVSREYSQRIATVATGLAISLQITPLMTITTITETAAAVTTTTRITMAAVRTIMTMRIATLLPSGPTESRMASVQFTVLHETTGIMRRVTTRAKILVTLPPASRERPWDLTLTRNLRSEFAGISNPAFVQWSNFDNFIGNVFPFPVGESGPFTITVVEGSEEFVRNGTLTTRTTMTMAAVSTTTTMTASAISTTTRVTTFATMTITIGATSAMGGTLPFDDGGGKGGGITKPPPIINPSFSRDSAGISKPKRRFPRLRRENDDEGGGNDNNITTPPPIIAATKPTPSFPSGGNPTYIAPDRAHYQSPEGAPLFSPLAKTMLSTGQRPVNRAT